MDETSGFSLKESLSQTYEQFAREAVDNAPEFLGAVALLLIGWLLAKLVQIVTLRLFGGVDSILNRFVRVDGSKQASVRQSYAVIVSRVLLWVVFLFFVAAAANLLGWGLFSTWMENLVAYLPRMVTGLLIVLAGLLLAGTARALVTKGAHSAGVEHSELLGRIGQIVVVLIMTVIGVEQAGINVHFFTDALVVAAGVFLAGGALAFGLGARSLVANVIGAQYAKSHYKLGEQLRIGEAEGALVEITQTSIVLDTGNGRAVVPAKLFHETVSNLDSGAVVRTPERPKNEETDRA
ncbi:mechanosensitive ion channel domain-containing protein [Pelagicoccus sp. SDUM812003]|uniref:mechanosensitive ion channel family protein n=1 Tax=Pelagicoccus sp. SDUM812003 TaxID=3041267 RepID=UPI0028101A1A|nr:mechanosensitive ion channel domain-containing protein [Pelagicoccus sp. SDUM812003]MDQ8205502.1 mechanosensitive ion channel [Pelagicoccus sp. SDUM812003]